MHIPSLLTLTCTLATLAVAAPSSLEPRRNFRDDVARFKETKKNPGTVELCVKRKHKDCTRIEAVDRCIELSTERGLTHLNKQVSGIRVADGRECIFYTEPGCKSKEYLGTWAKIDWGDLSWHKNWPNWEDRFQSVMCWSA